MDCFALGGLLMPSEQLGALIDNLENLKRTHRIEKHLRSHEIRTRQGQFRWLEQDDSRAAEFHRDLDEFMRTLPGHAVGCCVHRPGYNKRFAERYGADRWLLCRSAYAIVIERCAKIAARHGRRLKVYIEETGKREDQAIRRYHSDLRSRGTYFDPATSARYAPLEADALQETLFSEPTFVSKNAPGAQVADLLVYALAKGRYAPDYTPFRLLRTSGRIIDAVLSGEDARLLGVKYYCFDDVPVA
jgi:hypothetical protein